MNILGNLNTDFFKPTVAHSKVAFSRDSFMQCINAFVDDEIRRAEIEIRRLQGANWSSPTRREALIKKQEQKKLIVSGWKNKNVVDRRVTNMLSISGLVRVWGEMTPHVPFVIAQKPYIMAQTTDVILTDDDTGDRFDLGPFIIMLPLGGQVGEMHWVPVRDPKARVRHPHHGAYQYGDEKSEANTCLGSFQDYVTKSLKMGDVVSLLRFMSEYIRSYDPHSPLYYMRDVGHAIKL